MRTCKATHLNPYWVTSVDVLVFDIARPGCRTGVGVGVQAWSLAWMRHRLTTTVDRYAVNALDVSGNV
ncbi:hypothetical protein BDR07DRAFT_1417930, partial [Suillus spraguei]